MTNGEARKQENQNPHQGHDHSERPASAAARSAGNCMLLLAGRLAK
jgi:hypothetical protein